MHLLGFWHAGLLVGVWPVEDVLRTSRNGGLVVRGGRCGAALALTLAVPEKREDDGGEEDDRGNDRTCDRTSADASGGRG